MSRLSDIRENFRKGFATYEREAIVQRRIAETLASHIIGHAPQPARLLEIGCGTGFLTRALGDWSRSSDCYLNDLNEETRSSFEEQYRFIFGNAEDRSLPDNLDAIVSASVFQWFHDLPCFFGKAFNLLNAGGFLAFSTFGPSHFKELRHLTGNGLSYFSRNELTTSLKDNDFELLLSDEETIELFFEKPLDVLRHLRKTGVNGGFQLPGNIGRIREFLSRYEGLFSTEQGIPLTFHPIYIVAKKYFPPFDINREDLKSVPFRTNLRCM